MEFRRVLFRSAYVITKLINAVVSTANLEAHSFILKQMYIERELIKITHNGIEERTDVLEQVANLETKLRKITQISSQDDFKTLDDAFVSLYKHMDTVKDKDVIGITTGFKQLDKITGGLMPGGMYVVAARPSVGKSAFMGRMVIGAAKQGKQVGIISLEMNNEQISARLASLTTEVEFWRIYRNRMMDQEQQDDFYRKMNQVARLPIRISDNASVNINDIKAKVSKLSQRGQLDILFIDYLGLIDTEGSNRNYNREQEVSKISRGVKLMAMQYEIPVVILSQLNRMSEAGGDKKPKLHHLRESGSIEQDADGVLFIHRDFMSGIKTNSETGMTTESEADLIIAKWRNGEVCEYKIGFDGQRMKFYEPEENAFPQFKKIESPFV